MKRSIRTGYRAQQTGASFENEIETANRYYQMHRRGTVAKVPTGTRPIGKNNGQMMWAPAEKTGCDYLGVYKGIAVAVEAKSTSYPTRFPLFAHRKPMIKDHQLEFLKHFEESGGKAYILMQLKEARRVFRVPVMEYLAMKEKAEQQNKKSIPIGWLEETTSINKNGYVLDYLNGIEKEGANADD